LIALTKRVEEEAAVVVRAEQAVASDPNTDGLCW